jgi:glutathione S-transferase
MSDLPILFSFRRCPYAIRARMALACAGIRVAIREVDLKNKPPELLAISPKATVPVLHLPSGEVLAESLEIMHWALAQNDPQGWLAFSEADATLLAWNDGEFKYFLDRYKYADRYPEFSEDYYRGQGEVFLAELESRLKANAFLCGASFALADAAIFPFVRQFAAVDNAWFQACPYPALRTWLEKQVASDLFTAVMLKGEPNKSPLDSGE